MLKFNIAPLAKEGFFSPMDGAPIFPNKDRALYLLCLLTTSQL